MKSELSSQWFIRLRWFAFLGQSLLLLVVVGHFKLTLPWPTIFGLLCVIPISNLFAKTRFINWVNERTLIGGLLALDTLLLSAILFHAGGPMNPFSIVYLLHVVLAAVMLSPAWTWAVALLSSACFGALFVDFIPVPEWSEHGMHHGFSLHLHGMLIAYVAVALLVAFFLNRIVGELRRKERRLERLENQAINQRRLMALTSLSASAAHELGTPLGTIALIGHELERVLSSAGASDSVLSDLEIIKNETARCKKILAELTERSGEVAGEMPRRVTLSSLVSEALEPLARLGSPVEIKCESDAEVFVPRRAVMLGFRALIKNALEASTSAAGIRIEIRNGSEQAFVEVVDYGQGMAEELLERLGEPFFSTKGPEKGMGLGVYLAKLTAEQIGGKLEFKSEPGQGTVASFAIPKVSILKVQIAA